MDDISTVQKAILVLVSMEKEQAVKVVRQLNNREIKRISTEIGKISKTSPEELMEVLEEFMAEVTGSSSVITTGEQWIKDVIERAVGTNKAQHLLRDLGPPTKVFDSLFDIDLNALANLIRKEHPQTQALILAHLDPTKAAGVLPLLPEQDQVDIILRIAKITSIHPDLLAEIEDALMEEIQRLGAVSTAEAGGVEMVVDMLNIMEKKHEKTILTGIEQEDPKLAEEIKGMMFVFEDLSSLDDRSLQLILREVDQQTLVMALKAANEDMVERVKGNVSKRAAQMLDEDLDALGPVRLSEVETAQGEIVRVALKLEEEGKIVASSGEEEYV